MWGSYKNVESGIGVEYSGANAVGIWGDTLYFDDGSSLTFGYRRFAYGDGCSLRIRITLRDEVVCAHDGSVPEREQASEQTLYRVDHPQRRGQTVQAGRDIYHAERDMVITPGSKPAALPKPPPRPENEQFIDF